MIKNRLDESMLDDLMTREEAILKIRELVYQCIVPIFKSDIKNIDILLESVFTYAVNISVALTNSNIDPALLEVCQKSLSAILTDVELLKTSFERDLALIELTGANQKDKVLH